jgi:hypothetical protein
VTDTSNPHQQDDTQENTEDPRSAPAKAPAGGFSAEETSGEEISQGHGKVVHAFRRVFALVSDNAIDRFPGPWLHTRAVQAGGRLVIAVDGKTVRGAKSKSGRPRT